MKLDPNINLREVLAWIIAGTIITVVGISRLPDERPVPWLRVDDCSENHPGDPECQMCAGDLDE
jgi:hypothetical protein